MASRHRTGFLLSLVLLLPLMALAQEATPPVPSHQIRDVIANSRSGVLKIEAGLSNGTGFLLDTEGYVATNDHVVGTSAQSVSVYVDSVTRVAARVVARDRWSDVAILRIAPSACSHCKPLRWSDASPLQIADPVIVLGYPLAQPLTATIGIVSALRDGALMTDANINPGNSGGPVLAEDGTVVAMATFASQQERVGPGLGGAILLTRVSALLQEARKMNLPAPAGTPLPVVPIHSFPRSQLKAIADTIDAELYDIADAFTAGPFEISVVTPLSIMVHQTRDEADVGAARRKREEKAGLPEEERYAYTAELRDWVAYVGWQTAPVVAVSVTPRASETSGSTASRMLVAALGGVEGSATLKFKGDVRGVVLKRNGVVVEPLRGGHTPIRVSIDNVDFELKDVADFGYYLYPPEAFRPDGPQRPPEIVLEILDLKSPSKVRKETLPAAFVARSWNDFEGFYQRGADGAPFQRYVLTKVCTTPSGATALLGSASAQVAATCDYIVPPASSLR